MLGACALAPGMKMTEPAEVQDGVVVRVQPITLDLLNRMQAEREVSETTLSVISIRRTSGRNCPMPSPWP